MSKRLSLLALCVGLLIFCAWLGRGEADNRDGWREIVPGVWRSPAPIHHPAGYALLHGEQALLIDAPADLRMPPKVRSVDLVLLTHHHRDSAEGALHWLAQGVSVRASKASAEFLKADNVRKYWQSVVPMRNSRANFFVLPEGSDRFDCSLVDGQSIRWHDWHISAVSTPGHSRDHLAYAVRREAQDALLVFCGDAFFKAGKLWTPFTTDWDHWTDAGLKPTAESLRKLATLKPAKLLPTHGSIVEQDCVNALLRTAEAVEEVGFLKSFERYSKQRLGNAPKYDFLAPSQVGTGGDKPFTQISDHLYVSGNTYVLTSREESAFLVVDPWGKRSADQVHKLKSDRKLGKLEVVLFTHSHYDHYDGVYELPERQTFAVWGLNEVARPIAEPSGRWAPFLDARPVQFDRLFRDNESVRWREYTLTWHHTPGQTYFASSIEITIDGKRCVFTGDNFFHQDQYSGSGGWMGLNRSWPVGYAATARKISQLRPDWVLAEHGGPFVFDAEDFRRRADWADACSRAASAMCMSGDDRVDWNPHRVSAEPIRHDLPRAELQFMLIVSNPSAKAEVCSVKLAGRGLLADAAWEIEVPPSSTVRRPVALKVNDGWRAGRHAFPLRLTTPNGTDVSEGFVIVDVAP